MRLAQGISAINETKSGLLVLAGLLVVVHPNWHLTAPLAHIFPPSS